MSSVEEKIKALNVGSYVLVQWEDATTLDGWQAANLQLMYTDNVVTVGIVIAVPEGALTVAHSIGKDASYICGAITIPARCINSVKMLVPAGK